MPESGGGAVMTMSTMTASERRSIAAQQLPSPSNTLPRCKRTRERPQSAFQTPTSTHGLMDMSGSKNSTAGPNNYSESNGNGTASSSHSSRSFIRIRQRAKRVRFFRNGDQFFKGIWYAITPDRFRSFEFLLEDLTRSLDDLINLPHGVRHIFSIDGQEKISNISELTDQCSYVCSSNETFKKINYEKAREPIWNYSCASSGKQTPTVPAPLDPIPPFPEPNNFVRPRIITVIRNGVPPRKVVRLLLNKRTAQSFYQVQSDITAAVKLDSGVVKKIFTLNGGLVSGLEDFFKEDDVFIACGNERMSIDDFYLASEEYKFMYSSKMRSSSTNRPSGRNGSPKFNRKLPHYQRNSRLPEPNPSPLLRRRFLHQRNQKKIRTKRKQSSVEETESDGGSDNTLLDNHRNITTTPQSSRTTWTQPEPMQAHPLEIEDEFKIGRLIGDGNFAIVHEAISKKTRKSIALKIIDKSKCAGKELIDTEVSLLRRVKHPHIVELYNVWDFCETFYMAMELIKGGDLFDSLVSCRQYDEPTAAHLLYNLSSALDYLHSIDIVHRDVKPENLLIYELEQGRKQLKLADFGLATIANDVLYTVCGTPTYVAPEILAELGMENSQEELFDAILSGEYTFPSPYWDHVSNAAKGLIQGMLQLDVDDRYSAGEVLIHPWITCGGVLDIGSSAKHSSAKDFDFFDSQPSHSFFESENVEFYLSRRRSMDDLSAPSQPDLTMLDTMLSSPRVHMSDSEDDDASKPSPSPSDEASFS